MVEENNNVDAGDVAGQVGRSRARAPGGDRDRESLRAELQQTAAALAEAQAALKKLSAELRDKSAQLARVHELLESTGQRDMDALLEELRQKEQRIQQNTEVAKSVSELLLPALLPASDQVEIVARYRPTKAVGADLYDVIDMGHRCLGVLVADATGSGQR